MRKRRAETWLAWLLPFSPAMALVAIIGLSFRSKTVLNRLRDHKLDLFLWGSLAIAGLISTLLGYDIVRGFSNFLIPFLFIWAYSLGRWAIVDPRQFLVAMLRGTALLAAVMIVARIFELSLYAGNFPVLAHFGPRGRGIVLGVHSNGIAIVLEAGAVGGLGLLFMARRWRDRLEAGLVSVLSIAAIFITMSRGAMVGVAAGIVTGGLLFSPLALIPLAVAPLAGMAIFPQLRTRLQSIVDITNDGSNVARLRIWEGTWRMLKDHFWFGVGPGNFSQAYPLYSIPGYQQFRTPHSTYLNLISGWGILGGLLFFGWIGLVFIRSILRGLTPLHRVLIMILVAFWTHVVFDDLIALYAALLLGALENESHLHPEESPAGGGDK